MIVEAAVREAGPLHQAVEANLNDDDRHRRLQKERSQARLFRFDSPEE